MSTINKTISTGVVLGTASYTYPLTITAAGYVFNSASAPALSYAGAATVTVVNHGVLKSGSNHYAVGFNNNAIVTNTGTIRGAGGIEFARGTVINSGVIAGSTGGGIALSGDGHITNKAGGIISAGGFYAIRIINGSSPSTVVNYGTIKGPTGVYVKGSGSQTLIDSGTIIGTSLPFGAIYLGGTNDLVRLQPGSLLIKGKVNGGSGANRLEFASGASTGTLTGAGADFINFSKGTVDAGASWVFAGSNTLGAGVTLTVRGMLTNQGSITVANYDALAVAPGGYLRNDATGKIVRVADSSASRFDPAVVGLAGGASTIVNRGTIGNPVTDVGIYLRGGGTIVNGASNATSASLYGSGVGVYAYNQRGTVTNYGTIAGTGDNALGIGLATGGVITNGASDSTAALISGSAYGVLIAGGAGTVSNFGTIAGGYDAVHLDAGGTVVEAGKIVGGSHAAIAFGVSNGYGGSNNLLVLEHGFAITGAITASGTANVVELQGSAGSAVTANYNSLHLSGFQTVAFAPGAGNHATLTITNDAKLPGTIAGFTGIHDAIDLTKLSDAGNDAFTSFNTLTNVLKVTGDNGSVRLQLDAEDYTGTIWTAQNDGSNGIFVTSLCFCTGTYIATPDGEELVERLKAGDLVLTARGETRSIAWIGRGQVLATRGRRNAATPVIVRKGALADNVPHSDLHVTKGHSLYWDGVLVPVEFLVNHRTILWDDHAQEVTLYHVELETHDVLLANGAPAESYRDDGNRWLFQNANAGWDLPPRPPCAEVVTGGPIVDAIWRRLLDRAGPRPQGALTADPDLHLLVDGRRLDATQRADSAYVFSLPAVPRLVRVASRAASPAELGLLRDPRVLGVALRRVAVRAGSRFRVIEAADDRLVEGFHHYESSDGVRWTNGDAALPVALFDGFAGRIEVVLHIEGETQYTGGRPI